jgi:hypothetical protein
MADGVKDYKGIGENAWGSYGTKAYVTDDETFR